MMNVTILIVALSLALAISNGALPTNEEELPSLTRFSHMLHRHDPRATVTCDRFPRVCRAKGSLGHDCCGKRCVDVETDSLNCWECGRRCRYGEACCGGECVNLMFDRENCGKCKNKCKKGNFCEYGMCSYAD